ncbi:hypothetical protein RIU76_06630 [Latilactobacillus sakei subsp. sakei]|uniref:hypothetical protein n=1 Tax=Latilactobacillus sakei TaxID=1599 RepID=UPI002859D260|nr:hypothetical protein [Latilactobacillus sakei]MDR7924399.1 hypothetical protein [Latilactobacillus sakei subsp. sakei]
MKNTKRLMNIDRIVFGIMCALLIVSKQCDWAFVGALTLVGYFASSVVHTPEYFDSKEGE